MGLSVFMLAAGQGKLQPLALSGWALSPPLIIKSMSFLFLYTDKMTRTLPRMSTTMVKISTLASAVDTPAEDALSPRSLSFRDTQLDPFSSFTSKSISPQGAAAMLQPTVVAQTHVSTGVDDGVHVLVEANEGSSKGVRVGETGGLRGELGAVTTGKERKRVDLEMEQTWMHYSESVDSPMQGEKSPEDLRGVHTEQPATCHSVHPVRPKVGKAQVADFHVQSLTHMQRTVTEHQSPTAVQKVDAGGRAVCGEYYIRATDGVKVQVIVQRGRKAPDHPRGAESSGGR
ncbi:hypothetical protein FQN60_010418 [Etheostoma spectabile]|uniref:Uncharacterized protein n=1 Tax=Etheostoma spectabile TaxID=54343 RepID=A0A5J5D7R7_9PERO|nr:hypothetical protein FQN60_010418 [Etheostoma spectabile]